MTVPSAPRGGWVMWAGTVGFATPVIERRTPARPIEDAQNVA